MSDGRPRGTPKGCVAWMRSDSWVFHRGAHRLGPTCRKAVTRAGEVGLAVLRDRAQREETA